MLDSDLDVMYQTETKYINRAINRNPHRFPPDFAFQLSEDEWNALRFQFGTSSSKRGGRRYMPYVFTEHGVFFEGQLFDAYVFVSEIIKSANNSIELIDNYVDETTLVLLGKRKNNVGCTIFTRLKTQIIKDIEKHNQQYATVKQMESRASHDRFLIIDNVHLFHFGASLKDLGNKCFAFSQMDDLLEDLRVKLF